MQESVQQDRRMETIPREKGRDKGRGGKCDEGRRETFREPGCDDARPLASRVPREAHIPGRTAECASAENEGNSYCLVSRRPLNLPADLLTIVLPASVGLRRGPRAVDFAFLSYVLLGRFRRVILLLRPCDGPVLISLPLSQRPPKALDPPSESKRSDASGPRIFSAYLSSCHARVYITVNF